MSETPPDGPQFNPQSGFPVAPGDLQQPPAYPQQGYPNQPYGQPYGQPYPQAPGQPPYGYGYPVYARPDHPRATTSMVLGIVALAGVVFCYLPLLLGPVAWIISARTRRQIRSAPQQWGGESKATAGMVTGIIATVILVLSLIAVAVIVTIGVTQGWDTYDDGSGSGSDSTSALAALTAG